LARERKNEARAKDGWTCEGVHPAIVFARVRNALKRKEVAAFLKGLVCTKSAQAEENAGLVFCAVKLGIVVTGKSAISAPGRIGVRKSEVEEFEWSLITLVSIPEIFYEVNRYFISI